jgi:cytoskeleton protein RodZ
MMTIEQMTASSSPDSAANDAAADQASVGSGHTTPGAMLRAAREALGLSVGDVSTRMRMGVRQIEALERAEYAALPSGTFLRGMVRNYAKAVNVDADAAIRLLEETYSQASVSLKDAKIVVPSQNIKVGGGPGFFSTNRLKVFGLVAIAILVAGAAGYWWHYIRPQLGSGTTVTRPTSATGEKSVAVTPPQVQPATPPVAAPSTGTTPVEQPAVAPVTPPAAAPAATPTTATPPPAVTAPPPPAQSVASAPVSAPATATATVTPQPTLAESSSSSPVAESTKLKTDANSAARPAGTSVLGFTFGGESWVEVVDGRGRTLVARRYESGETEEVSGRAPFSIVVGNAAQVRMAYNGKEFDLKPHTRTRTARLTLK